MQKKLDKAKKLYYNINVINREELKKMRRKSLRRRKIEAITNLVGTIILLLALIKFGFWVINGAEKENARSTPSYMQSVK